MQFFRVPHPPFAGVLCNQSHCVFFFGYTSPLCIQKLLGGLPLNLDRYGDKFLPFSAQNGMTRYRHCHTDSPALQILFKYLARILTSKIAVQDDPLCIPHIQARILYCLYCQFRRH